jgi:hypothetical protein
MMNIDEIKGILTGEMSNCNEQLLVERKRTSEKYYQGDLPLPPDIKGRSGVVSTDVADCVEWLMPNIIESLSGKSVKFMPMSAQDEAQADLETDITHFTFSEDNNGYLALYEVAKDALMTGVGIFKIWYDDAPERVVESYAGIDDNQLQALLADPMVEVTQIERSEIEGIRATAARIIRSGRVRVQAIPAEEFRVADDLHSLDLKDARFCAHTCRKTVSELLAEGYDPEQVENAAENYVQNEIYDYNSPDTSDDSQRLIVVTEAFLHIDINEDAIAELCKITYTGESTVDEILDIEEVAEMPFVAMSAIPNPHKFVGTSIFDRLRQVQDIKTAVLRSTLDSFYQSINRIKVVTEGQVNIDDLLVSRPGGIIRAKAQNAVTELGGTFFGGEALQLLQYADEQKSARVGVNPNMAGQTNLINQESAHGVERMMSSAEMLVNLCVRNIAETGIRPAYKLIRDLLVRYQDSPVPFKHRGQWMNIVPSEWGERSRMMVTVGTGRSDDDRKLGTLQAMLGVQQQIMQDPSNTLVDYDKIYETLSEISDVTGFSDAGKFFYDPTSPEGAQFNQMKAQMGEQQQQQAMQEQQRQIEMQVAQLQAQQTVANAEAQKAQAALQNGQLKAEIDYMRNQHAAEIDALKAQLQAVKDSKESEFKVQKLKTDAALKLTELEIAAKRDLSQQTEENKQVAES